MTRDDVFKVKRPQDYGFLDYTTPELRRHYCEEEVRLNRRTARDVYVGVLPVYRDARGYSLTRRGEIVDAAVHMRRLPDECSALAMVRRGRLAHADLDALAAKLAPFYAARLPGPQGRSLAVNVAENFAQVAPFAGRLVEPSLLAEINALQRGWLEDSAALLATRPNVDGHGDLRLEHVYFLPEGPTVIDCIEFTDRFRVGDPALDFAFLAMDLEREWRLELADYLLGRFAFELDDYDFYPLIDGYVSYRAFVRGKVACFVAADPATAADVAARKEREALWYFELARSAFRRARAKTRLVAVGGVIASGKSTVADTLARAHGVAVVSADATRKNLAGIGHEEPGGQELYTEAMTRRVHDEIAHRADCVLSSGRTVVVDTTCRTRALRGRLRDLAIGHGAAFRFVECRAPDAVCRARLRARRGGISDAREGLFDSFLRSFEAVDELPAGEHHVVDTTRRLVDMARFVITLLLAVLVSTARPAAQTRSRAIVAVRAVQPATQLLDVNLTTGKYSAVGRFSSDRLAPLALAVDPANRDLIIALAAGSKTRIARLEVAGLRVVSERILADVNGVATTMQLTPTGRVAVGIGGSTGRVVLVPRSGGKPVELTKLPWLTAMSSVPWGNKSSVLQSGRTAPRAPAWMRCLDLVTGKTLQGPYRFTSLGSLELTGIVELLTAVPRHVIAASDGNLYLSVLFGNPTRIQLKPVLPAGATRALRLTGAAQFHALGGKAHPFLKTTAWGQTAWKNLAGPLPGDPVDFDFAPPAVASVVPFGQSCPDPKAFLAFGSGGGPPSVGNQGFRLDVTAAPASTAVMLVIGASDRRFLNLPLPLPLPGGCGLLVAPALFGTTVTDARGRAAIGVPVPNDPRLAGTIFYAEWLRLARSGFVASQGLAMQVW